MAYSPDGVPLPRPKWIRYALNSFIRAVKRLPRILKMEIQHKKKLREGLAEYFAKLLKNDLFQRLSKRRDFLVHQGMLAPASRGSIGTSEGNKVKISFPFAVSPYETSEEAYERYKAACRKNPFFRSLAGPDEDSVPCVWRIWSVPDFPNRDILDVAIDAWSAVGAVLSAAIELEGGETLDLRFGCRQEPEAIRVKRFSQREFFQSVDGQAV